jgi:hypothetical protein
VDQHDELRKLIIQLLRIWDGRMPISLKTLVRIGELMHVPREQTVAVVWELVEDGLCTYSADGSVRWRSDNND